MKQAKHVDPEALRPFMGQWVALDQSGEHEKIVGTGASAKDAIESARAAGHRDPCLMFVPRGPVVTTPAF